ncbi:uncharacterized protein [Macrobrachium rosenbergii]|uniref:uncharacterized protein n=1 Tax=Macrobrachium rosenbergii TaxID=79674 RepID=UPI0034D6BC1F
MTFTVHYSETPHMDNSRRKPLIHRHPLPKSEVHLRTKSLDVWKEEQARRKGVVREVCERLGLSRSKVLSQLMQSPKQSFLHFLVDDARGAIYCYIPKVACTNWKKVWMVLTGLTGERNLTAIPLMIPHENTSKMELTKNATVTVHFYGANLTDIQWPEFVDFLTLGKGQKADDHWNSYMSLCHPCAIDYDVIAKMETLQEDSDRFLRLIEAPEYLHFPNTSRTSRRTDSVLWSDYQRQLSSHQAEGADSLWDVVAEGADVSWDTVAGAVHVSWEVVSEGADASWDAQLTCAFSYVEVLVGNLVHRSDANTWIYNAPTATTTDTTTTTTTAVTTSTSTTTPATTSTSTTIPTTTTTTITTTSTSTTATSTSTTTPTTTTTTPTITSTATTTTSTPTTTPTTTTTTSTASTTPTTTTTTTTTPTTRASTTTPTKTTTTPTTTTTTPGVKSKISYDFWIGLNDLQNENSFKWSVDDSSLGHSDYAR